MNQGNDGYEIHENFRRLWAAEDDLIRWSEGMIAEIAYLKDHIDSISTYLSCVKAVQESGLKSQRHTAICGLFMRTFDSIGHSVRSCMSGNYTGSAMYARDALETHFLLSYLLDEDGRPEDWLKAEKDRVKSDYSPVKIRKYLDERDGFSGKKRHQHYEALSSLGVHPTPQALELKRDGTRSINMGPFKQRDLLKECLEEIAKIVMLLSANLSTYSVDVPQLATMNAAISLRMQKTREQYFRTEDSSLTGGK